jgi:hypothetical protein
MQKPKRKQKRIGTETIEKNLIENISFDGFPKEGPEERKSDCLPFWSLVFLWLPELILQAL